LIDLVKEILAAEGVTIPYSIPHTQLSAVQRDVPETEVMIRAAWLFTLKAIWPMVSANRTRTKRRCATSKLPM
jgi:hypothetical protein